MILNFTKMHGLGNDFIVVDDRDSSLRQLARLSSKLCNRRFGIGADQLLLLGQSDRADYRMRIFNADGSEVEMCGNGIRCLGKYIFDVILRCDESPYAKKYCQTIDSISIETMAGLRHIHRSGNLFRIDMGEPVFEPEKIPVAQKSVRGKSGADGKVHYSVKAGNTTYRATCLSMGNPHAVIFVKNIDSIDLQKVGPLLEKNSLFPNRTNVEFVEIQSNKSIRIRVWERGAGATMACGTGASAAAVASALRGRTGRKINVHLPGGKLVIQWSQKDNHVYMTGPAEKVFEGSVEI